MWKILRKVMVFLSTSSGFKEEQDHDHEDVALRKDLVKTQQALSEALEALAGTQQEVVDVQQNLETMKQRLVRQNDKTALCLKETSTLQEKLSASQAHVKILESVLEESNKTIEALNLAIDLRENENIEGLQNYIDELETEIDEAVDLITKYGLQLRKM